MDRLERERNGQGVSLALRLQAELRTPSELHVVQEDVRGTFNVAEWLSALDQAGFGSFLLFEVPLPSDLPEMEVVRDRLDSARRHLAAGHYSEVVAACRLGLEALTQTLGQEPAMKAARDQHKKERTALDLPQRELIMRQAVMDFSSLAHHTTGVPLGDMFDRNSAQLILGSTAALISSALARRVAETRAA